MKRLFWSVALGLSDFIRLSAGVIEKPIPKLRPGDVAIDCNTSNRVTVECVGEDRAEVAWFEGSTLHRGSLLCRELIRA